MSFDFIYFSYRRQKINDFIEALAGTGDPNNPANQAKAERIAGLNLNDLTSNEIEYIESEVAKKFQ